MGAAFRRAHLAPGDPPFRMAAGPAAGAGLRARWRSSAGQCHGLAGDAELLLDLAALPARGTAAKNTEAARRAALVAADALLLQRRTPAARGTGGIPLTTA